VLSRHFLLVHLFFLLASQTAFAHFQMLQVDEYMRDKSGPITLSMPFTHPSHGGPMMAMDEPYSLIMHHKGKQTELTDIATELNWQGVENASLAFQSEAKLKGLGDYTFTLTPAPYLEESEDTYIQQFTKTTINVGGLPTDWDQSLLLEAEIVPDQKPYAVYAGGLFSAVVMAKGKPKVGVEVEVEFLNHPVNSTKDGFEKEPLIEYPKENLNITTVRTDNNGRFFFGVPHEGYWGFAALGVGEKVKYLGKDLSQDAVLWIQAHQLKRLR
jgi:cobalt/nickel transport protein